MPLQDSEKISGNKLVDVFRRLQKDRTILRLNLIGKGYEGLTIVTDIRADNGYPYLLIDYPGGSGKTIADSEGGRAFFEFSGEDNKLYGLGTNYLPTISTGYTIKF